jgi:hypothetical protein
LILAVLAAALILGAFSRVFFGVDDKVAGIISGEQAKPRQRAVIPDAKRGNVKPLKKKKLSGK